MLPARPAQLHHRTLQAQRSPRQTNRRPQLHHRLVVIPRRVLARRPPAGRRHQPLRRIHQPRPRLRPLLLRLSQHPQQHPLHIPIQHRHALPKRNARNRRPRILPHPRQRPQLRRRPRQLPAKLPIHKLRPAMQHPRPPVVSQPTPQRQHIFFLRHRQVMNRRKPPQKLLVPVHHRRHPRLLQHDLRQPRRIRIPHPAPRQLPRILPIPRPQPPPKPCRRKPQPLRHRRPSLMPRPSRRAAAQPPASAPRSYS